MVKKRGKRKLVNMNKRRLRKQARDHKTECRNHHVKAPVPAIVLTQEQWGAIKEYSKLVKLRRVWLDNKENCLRFNWDLLFTGDSFSQQTCGFIIAEASSLEAELIEGSHLISKKNLKYQGAPYEVGTEGKVLLVEWNRKVDLSQKSYTKDLLAEVDAIKPSIIGKGEKHHGSVGLSYGYGCRASYDKIQAKANLNSMDHYSLKKSRTIHEKHLIGDAEVATLNKMHESCMVRSLEAAVECLNEPFKGVAGTSVVSSGTCTNKALVEAAHKANHKLRENIYFLGTTKFPSGYINKDAETKRSHSEEDPSMTVLSVPPQDWLLPEQTSPATMNFYLTGEATTEDPVAVVLNVGMSLFFSGFFVVHRQERHDSRTLVNISAYGNKQLFSNSMKTLQRNIESKS